VLTKLAALSEEERRAGVIGISAGNHAQALAWGAAADGIDSLVVMWQGASPAKVAAAREYGAEVDLEAAGPAEAFERLDELIARTGRTLVHPFDDPAVIAGQGTVALEILDDVPETTVLVVPVGGGGLVSGVAVAACATGRRVVAVEPERSPALHDALAAGRSVPTEVASIADGLNAPFAGANAVAICASTGVEAVLVTEQAIEDGFRFLYGRAKLACEPAGAAGVAALLAGRVSLDPSDTVAVVVSGGNTAPETASAILGRR
jgi:threonine dehydratase